MKINYKWFPSEEALIYFVNYQHIEKPNIQQILIVDDGFMLFWWE